MPLFRSATRPGRVAPPRRARLFAEPLEHRDGPAGLTPDWAPPGVGTGSDTPAYVPARFAPPPPVGDPAPNVAPKIVDLTAEETGPGQFRVSGRVVDESPAGLTVTFGGIPGARGKSAVTGSDGRFFVYMTLKTDGTDAGTITAKTKDVQGLDSNTATVDVSPTPGP